VGDGEYTLVSSARTRRNLIVLGIGMAVAAGVAIADAGAPQAALGTLVLVAVLGASLAWTMTRMTARAVLDDAGITMVSPGRRRTLRWDELVAVGRTRNRRIDV